MGREPQAAAAFVMPWPLAPQQLRVALLYFVVHKLRNMLRAQSQKSMTTVANPIEVNVPNRRRTQVFAEERVAETFPIPWRAYTRKFFDAYVITPVLHPIDKARSRCSASSVVSCRQNDVKAPLDFHGVLSVSEEMKRTAVSTPVFVWPPFKQSLFKLLAPSSNQEYSKIDRSAHTSRQF